MGTPYRFPSCRVVSHMARPSRREYLKKTSFTVDSGAVLVIDPCYLEEFALHFSSDEYADYIKQGGNAQEYINQVTARAFPASSRQGAACLSQQMVGLLEADPPSEFWGDGHFQISSKAIKMTPEYKKHLDKMIERALPGPCPCGSGKRYEKCHFEIDL